MDKLSIYNRALGAFDIPPLEVTDLDTNTSRPDMVGVLDLNIGPAIRKASREWNWSFLEQPLELGEDKGPKAGYKHSYNLPFGTFKLTHVEGLRYRRIGEHLLTDGKAEAYGIMEVNIPKRNGSFFVPEGTPDDFWDLVVFALASFIGPKLSPGDEMIKVCDFKYRTILQGMIQDECINSSGEYLED